jgi:hypothetical protein
MIHMTTLKAFGAAIIVAASLGAAGAAVAAPAAPAGNLAADGLITHVAQGCGPAFHRGPYGRCVPNFAPRRAFGPRCVIRPTPVGPRRICR